MIKKNLKIKLSLFFIVSILALSFFSINWYIINQFRNQLNKQVKSVANMYYEKLNTDSVDSKYLLDTLLPLIHDLNIPIIITTKQSDGSTIYEHINIDDINKYSSKEYNTRIFEIIKSMDEINDPLPVLIIDDIPIIEIHYGDSFIINNIRWLPYLQFSFAIIVLAILFIGIRLILSNEKNFIYAGMSRETAHQLGTPISSLMGWVELLSRENSDRNKILNSMKKDINRLENISDKFNKIGSVPILDDVNVTDVLNDVVNYYNSKLPKTSNINICLDIKKKIIVASDRVLLYWAFENLIKNSIESVSLNKDGQIKISCIFDKNIVHIDFLDNGFGIARKFKSQIFNPGFSTKKRGWGIGLNLSKRIIEHIHKGNLKLVRTKKGETLFRISLILSTS